MPHLVRARYVEVNGFFFESPRALADAYDTIVELEGDIRGTAPRKD